MTNRNQRKPFFSAPNCSDIKTKKELKRIITKKKNKGKKVVAVSEDDDYERKKRRKDDTLGMRRSGFVSA